jgi:cytochrome c-type biogenesis protein CcmH
MSVFWILAALMVGAALAIVLVPLLRRRARSGPTQSEVNLAVLRGQRREIEQDVAAGTLAPEAREEALAELAARADAELAQEPERPAPAAAAPSRPWIAAVIAGVSVPAIAVGLYFRVGNPAALDPAAAKADAPMGDHEIAALVDNLARKVRERPDDAQGWVLLARSMAALGRHPEAAEAYAHLVKLVPDDASILADYADSLGMAQGRSLAGKPYELVKQALKIDPRHPKALALAGTVTLHQGDYAASLGYWQRLAADAAPGSEEEKRLASILEEVREKAKAAGKPLPPGPVPMAKAPPAASGPAAAKATAPKAPPGEAARAAGGASVSGTVSLAPALAAKVSPSDTLFIYARAEGGSRVPLAIIRGAARELPRDFDLDDSLSMSPAFRLSTAAEVRVEARVSRSGSSSAQAGDLAGTSAVVKPGTRGVKVLIDREIP